MGKVIEIDPEFMEAWGLATAQLIPDEKGVYQEKGLIDLQTLLDKGYEPFSVVPSMLMPPAGILGVNQPKPIMTQTIWLKIKQRLPKVASPLPEKPKTS